MSVRLTPEAQADLREIHAWYATRNVQLGRDFAAAFSDVARLLKGFPESGAVVHVDVRRVLLRRFPYCVFYVLEEAGPVVFACFHASRDPTIWQIRPRS